MNQLRGQLFHPLLRGMEKVLPPGALFQMLWPVLWVRAMVHAGIKGRPGSRVLPSCLGLASPGRPPLNYRFPLYADRILENFPDRLPNSKWLSRCRFPAREHILKNCREKSPQILVFLHFGSYCLLRHWLRAFGIPLVTLVAGPVEQRNGFTRRKDLRELFPEIPNVLDRNHLKEAIRCLEQGVPVAAAVDVDSGRQVEVELPDGWRFRMATGPVRLARRCGADLVPCNILHCGQWRYRIECGLPIPYSMTHSRNDADVCSSILSAFQVHLKNHPGQWSEGLARRFLSPEASGSGQASQL